MWLDRLIDPEALELAPFALCDLRRGTRLELGAAREPHLFCALRGTGVLHVQDQSPLPLGPCCVALVPAGLEHELVPEGGGSRRIALSPRVGSDHLPSLTLGSGEVGLLLACCKLQPVAERGGAHPLVDDLQAPAVVDLRASAPALAACDALLHEHEHSFPGRRAMCALLLRQLLVHALRTLPELWPPAGTREPSREGLGSRL